MPAKEETKDVNELKIYIKEMNKFLDEPAAKNKLNTEESEDDDYPEEDLPKVSADARP